MTRSAWRVGCAVAALVVLAAPARGQSCAGDCDGDGAVRIAELVTAVNVALGNAALGSCAAVDTDGDGAVGVAELVRAVRTATEGCDAVIDGTCLQPGPTGLQPCTPENTVRLLRCDDVETCLEQAAGVTVIDLGRVSASGSYRFSVPPQAIAGEIIILDAVVDAAATTLYRVIDLGPAAVRPSASPLGGRPGQSIEPLVIDPSSEAAVRLIQECGLANLDPGGLRSITDAVRAANAGTNFDGLTAAEAAALAVAAARDDAGVQEAIARAKLVDGVTVRVGTVAARPGETVELAVSVRTGGQAATAVEHLLTLDPMVLPAARPDGAPDCTVAATHPHHQGVFAFKPPGCVPGGSCAAIKAVVVDLTDFTPLGDGAVLYACRLRLRGDVAAGSLPLGCSAARFSPPPPAPLPAPAAACIDGGVLVLAP